MTELLKWIQSHWVVSTLVILIAITVLSLWPPKQLPPVPGTDKTHHLIAYAVLMIPTVLKRPRHWILIGLLFLAYGGLIELVQPYVNRYGEWLDLAADAAGLVSGWLLAELLCYAADRNLSFNRYSNHSE